MPSFLRPILHNPAQPFRLTNERNGKVLADDLTLAIEPAARRKGLLGRDRMGDREAMILKTSAVHTWFMRFAIDVAFVARDGRVVKTRTALPPWRMAVAFRAYGVIEMPAGTLARSETATGDRLVLIARESEK